MMLRRKIVLFIQLLFFTTLAVEAHVGPLTNDQKKGNNNKQTTASLREPCSPGTSQIAQDINNVRARLLINGDVWWDGSGMARYVVPKVEPGEPEVSSIYAAAVWLGGLDEGGSLKLAVKTYGSNSGRTDFWPGPIDPGGQGTEAETCQKWDKHFEVLGTDIQLHLANWQTALINDQTYEEQDIPESIRGWPARGNDFFFDVHNFNLPLTDQGLANYFDQNGNDKYEPDLGDYPIIEIRGCEGKPQFPDEMIFWIYNDVGNTHTESDGEPMNMEVQVQSFAYATNDEINDMTFQRYKLINRGVQDVDSCFFAMWVDADLGCDQDDYIGCDTSRSLAYYYNADLVDGIAPNSCDCAGIETYCERIPMIGIDYFRGPLDEFGEQIGMSSFTYYNRRSSQPPPLPGTDDPETAEEYYNYLSGSWRDGTPFTLGGDGYDSESTDFTNYAFPNPPNDPSLWSMSSEGLPLGDRRTIQASGPFTLKEDTKNELIIGAVWVPNVPNHPTPDISKLLFADDIAQSLFDNCFEIPNGPDAPDLDWVELDQELIVVLSNDTIFPNSNNAFELYEEDDFQAPPEANAKYFFEGYRVFQMRGASDTDVTDIDVAREVIQVDVQNGVKKIFNWETKENPLEPGGRIFSPIEMVDGIDEGIRHSFQLTTDAFTNEPLINHKRYYYRAIAYGYNNFKDFDVSDGTGQRRAYLPGRRNIRTYTVIPRPIVDRNLQASFGDGVVISRLDGAGVRNSFLDLEASSREATLEEDFDGILVYKKGQGPIDVNIYNPLEVKNGNYQLRFMDSDMTNNQLDVPAWWTIEDEDGRITRSETNIDVLNEQLLAEYGFTVSIAQTPEPGTNENTRNGATGIELEYTDPEGPQWFLGIPDAANGPFNYVKTEPGLRDQLFDPNNQLSTMGNGAFVPFFLCDWTPSTGWDYFLSPAWNGDFNSLQRATTDDGLSGLNNVDIVFTSDKRKWSRCVVVETANKAYYSEQIGLGLLTEGGRNSLDLRAALSVGKESDNNGQPVPDGALDENGLPLTGMGWFPGYAIDVETGQRLNIFFGENSVYDCAEPRIQELCNQNRFTATPVGRDMMWNPTDQNFVDVPGQEPNETNQLNFYLGGQHYIYVTSEPYDSCRNIHRFLSSPAGLPGASERIAGQRNIRWASMPMLQPETQLLSYEDGLIPNDLIAKIRVDNSYQYHLGTGANQGHPMYGIQLENVAAEEKISEAAVDSVLAAINVVPNPYYGFSDYENSQFSNIIKITNLPSEADVTIYTLDGKFVRQYLRNEVGSIPQGNNRGIVRNQIVPDLEWDLKNSKGIPVASGVYLIHVNAPGLGERVLKWFGIARQFDPSGL
ncbi:MAG: hypothetical protein AAF985_07500 [Bacteroidota bacterium]